MYNHHTAIPCCFLGTFGSIKAVFITGCSGQSCLQNYKEGMNKCFSDLTTLTKDEVISVLMEEQENARVSDIICRFEFNF